MDAPAEVWCTPAWIPPELVAYEEWAGVSLQLPGFSPAAAPATATATAADKPVAPTHAASCAASAAPSSVSSVSCGSLDDADSVESLSAVSLCGGVCGGLYRPAAVRTPPTTPS